MKFLKPLSIRSLAALASAMVAVTHPAAAAGNAAVGKQIANRWCASCHVVTLNQESANADVPTFFAIAKQSAGDMDSVRDFLAKPHPPMPDISLSRAEIDDLITYISSLK